MVAKNLFMAALVVWIFAASIPSFGLGRDQAAKPSTNPRAMKDAGEGDALVSLPPFLHKDFLTRKHNSPEEDKDFPSSSRPPLPLQLLRARNLLAAGHYEEAIKDFEEGLPRWKIPIVLKYGCEAGWAVACEHLGRYDEAIVHAKAANADDLLMKYLLREQRYQEAKEVADNKVLDWTIAENESHTSKDLRVWLRLRACAECGLKDYASAVVDLKRAAEKYSTDNTEEAALCVHEANALIEHGKLGERFKLDQEHLPAKGKEKVIGLIKFLTTSSAPFSTAKLNAITGAHIKLPGACWHNIYQESGSCPPFDHLEYRVEAEHTSVPELLMLDVMTNECCVSKAEIDGLFPAKANKVPPISIWNGINEAPYAEAWQMPTGRLWLRFGKGGARVLEFIELNAPGRIETKTKTAKSYEQEARGLTENEGAKKIELLTKIVDLDDQVINSYIERAHAYIAINRLSDALADAKRAVALGGRFYLDEQAVIEEQMGNTRVAVEHMKSYIGDHAPGPETSDIFVRLSELQLKNKDYTAALDSANKAMIDSNDTAAALFAKAKAEAALNRLAEARTDGKQSVGQYFDKAQIFLRDRVLDWLNTLPAK